MTGAGAASSQPPNAASGSAECNSSKAGAAPALRHYQEVGRDWLTDARRAFLGDEPGLGKSAQMLLASNGDTLIVAPNMVLQGHTWTDEVEKWIKRPDRDRFTQAPYTSATRRKVIGENKLGQPVYAPIPLAREDLNQRWGTIILDEAHYMKGRKTTWTEALKPLCALAGRVYLATGTPIPNWAHELFVPLQLLFPDEAAPGARFGSYWRWVQEWFRVTPSRFGGEFARDIGDLLACGPACLQRPPVDPCDHYREFIERNLGGRFLMRMRDDVAADLPPLTQVTVECPMTREQAAAYRQMKREFIAQAGGDTLVAWNSGAKNVILDRITTGLEVAFHGRAKGSGKLARLRYDLGARSRPTVVYAHYRDTVDCAGEVAESVGARCVAVDGRRSPRDRGSAIRAFQNGRADVLVGSLETLAEGLTLTQADMAIMVEKSFKPSRNEQAIRRIHRLGQTRPCTILDYVTPKTVDAKKRELLAVKTDRAMRFLTAAQFAALL